jgi:hypothetical protein
MTRAAFYRRIDGLVENAEEMQGDDRNDRNSQDPESNVADHDVRPLAG